MSENPENTTESVYIGPVSDEHRDRRLHRILAWVGIVAGVVFIVTVIFFSGFALGRSSGYHGWHRGYHSQTDCPMRNGSMTGPGSMMGPGGMGPGGMMGPAGMAPGMMSPSQSPSASPSPAPPQR